MALFKHFRGNRASLAQQPVTDGYAYFCVDDGTFHIDFKDKDGVVKRKQINAKDAETINGHSVDDFLLEVDIDRILAQAKESGEFDGEDGISVTHTWNGTRLVITSASGTSSTDLKGEKGDQGVSGVYVGSGDMPEGYNIQIDPNGEVSIPGGDAIVDVLELPTEGINIRCFYRLKTAYLVFNQNDQRYNNFHCICVNSLPEVGKPVTTTMSDMLVYYSILDNEAYGYITDELGAMAGVPAGWYTLAMLAPVFNVIWKGIITDINDDPCDDSFRLLVTQEYYVYQDEWCKVPFAYERPPKYDIQWDGDMTDRVVLDMSLLGYPNTYFVKVCDDVFTTDEVIGWRHTALMSDGRILEDEIDSTMINIERYPGVIDVNSYIAILYDADTFSSALGIPSGIYTNGVYFWLDTEYGYISSFTSPVRITKIDKQYLALGEIEDDLDWIEARINNFDVLPIDYLWNIPDYKKQNARGNIDVYSKAEVDAIIANAIGNAIGGSY